MAVLGLMHADVVKEDNRDMLKDWMCKLGYLRDDRFANFFGILCFFLLCWCLGSHGICADSDDLILGLGRFRFPNVSSVINTSRA